MRSRQGPEGFSLFAPRRRHTHTHTHALANMCVTMDWSQFQYTHYDARTVGPLTICGQQAITELSLSLSLNWTSHGPLWAGVVCSPCSLRCRQFQFEILRSTRVGSKKWESLKIFTASQGRLREFYVTFYGADVTVTITVTSRCCWHSSAGFRRQRQLTQFVLEMNSSSHCSKESSLNFSWGNWQ